MKNTIIPNDDKDGGPRSAPGLQRVRRHSVAADVAEKLRRYIEDERLPAGHRLPTVEQLCQIFGVSRVAVREGLKLLEGSGLVVLQPGSKGGAFVAYPSRDTFSEAFSAYCQLQNISLRSLVEFRVEMERIATRWAAERITQQETAELQALVQRMRHGTLSVDDFQELDIAFHTAIALASKNPIFASTMYAIRNAMKRAMVEGFNARAGVNLVPQLVREHQEILDHIRAHEPEAAGEAVAAHIRNFYLPLLEGGDP